jgi:CubicO group peptidase (beta-lactamase class C family)
MPDAEFESRFPSAFDVYLQGLGAGLHIGAQICVSRHRELLANVGLGESRPGVAMTVDTLMPWLSAGKPITAAAILQQWERGRIDVDDPVAVYVPEFAQRGKEQVTVRHLLTHTSAFRFAALGYDDTAWADLIARINGIKLERDWIPGEKAGYHPLTSWLVLGEIVQRVDGRSFAQYVREEIFLPLGMVDSWIGMDVDTYRHYGSRIGLMQLTERADRGHHFYSTESGVTHATPGGGAIGPIHELARFYECLLAGGELDGSRILRGETVRAMTDRQREGMFDETFRATIDWGFGLLLDSKRYGTMNPPYGYGRFASDRTFGHGGSQSSVAFADPEYGLVVGLVFNGMPGEAAHQARMAAMLEAIYGDLRLGSRQVIVPGMT